MRGEALLAMLLGLAIGGAGCQSSKPAAQPPVSSTTPPPATEKGADTVTGAGTIVRLEIEGGFFAIRGDDGTNYDPKSLPDEFKVEGLRVRYTLKVNTGAAGIHMVGPIVDVIDIAKE
ncbi:MAG TPA: hypothetical protein VF720_01565 [Candidatus Eisenbacteria bacterium]